MTDLKDIILVAVVGATCGAMSGVTTWLLNVHNMEKARLEIERLRKELARSDNRLLTPDNPSWKHLSEEAIHTFETVRARSRLSSYVPAAIIAGVLSIIFLGGTSRTERELASQVASARSLAELQERQLAQIQSDLRSVQTALNQRETDIRQRDTERQQLAQTIESLIDATKWSRTTPFSAAFANQRAEECRREIERIQPILSQLRALSKPPQKPPPNEPK